MSTTTPVLGLTLYDATTDQVVTFATFRAVWGGTAVTSNFYKIDTAVGTIQSNITSLQNTRGAISVNATYVSANYYESTVALITSYITDMTIILKLDVDSAGTVTLNINSLGTKSVMKVNAAGTLVNIAAGELQGSKYYLFKYDGTQFVWVNATSSDQIYVVDGTNGNVVTVSSDGMMEGTTTQSVLISGTVHAATAKTTLADSDELALADSAASYVLKRITWANLKATLLTYFNTIYPAKTVVSVISSASPRVYTSNNTWTKPAGLIYIIVEVVGGGGAGGGAQATSANYSSGSGGGGGGYAKERIDAGSLSATESVTVGAGGTGASGAAGNNGGTSSFGSLLSATGGTGGGILSANTGFALSGTPGGGGVGSNGNINGGGGVGSIAGRAINTTLSMGGNGGSSIYGGGGVGILTGTTTGTGNAGIGYGGGGAGAANAGTQSAATGGAGAAGVVIVWEYVQAS